MGKKRADHGEKRIARGPAMIELTRQNGTPLVLAVSAIGAYARTARGKGTDIVPMSGGECMYVAESEDEIAALLRRAGVRIVSMQDDATL